MTDMLDADQIALLEGITQSAWPSLTSEMADGWLIRTNMGYTKRANSVTPLYKGVLDYKIKVAYCEMQLRNHDLPAIFKLTSAHAELDAYLEKTGYEKLDVSSVQTVVLRAPGHVGPRYGYAADVYVSDEASREWLQAFCRFNKISTANRVAASAMLNELPFYAAFALVREGKKVVAVGLGVLVMGYIVLFDISTHPDHRRQGHARRVVQTLLAWGQEEGAEAAVLQVVANNEPAIQLYEDFGFTEQYRYWYRRSDASLLAQQTLLRHTNQRD